MKNNLFIFIFCAFLVVFSACKHKNSIETVQVEPLAKSVDGGESVSVSADDTARLYVYSTEGDYLGMVNNKQYVVHIFSSTEREMTGVFFVVDSNLIMQAQEFVVTAEDSVYKATFEGKTVNIRMTYSANDEDFRAIVEVQKTNRNIFKKIIKQDLIELSFTRRLPDQLISQSDRYKKKVFEVQVDSNIVYGHAKGAWTSLHIEPTANYAKELLPYLFKTSSQKMLDLTMDIYQPVGDTLSKRPAVVLFHGGAFFFGDKHDSEMIAWCSHLASLGYVVFSVNYRMGFELTKASIQKCGFKAIQDGHAALRFVAHNVEKYRIDPDWIYAGGSSAGSIIAMNVLYMDENHAPKAAKRKHFAKTHGSLYDSGNNLKDKFKIKGLINMWGALYDISALKEEAVSIISFHGTADQVVPYAKGYPFSQLNWKDGQGGLGEMYFDEMYGSKVIHEALAGTSVHQAFYPLEGCGHAPYRNKEDGSLNDNYYFICDKVKKFLNEDLVYDIHILQIPDGIGYYRLVNCDASEIHWYAEGGVVLARPGKGVKVRFFENEPKHTLRVSGLLRNGASFYQEINITDNEQIK